MLQPTLIQSSRTEVTDLPIINKQGIFNSNVVNYGEMQIIFNNVVVDVDQTVERHRGKKNFNFEKYLRNHLVIKQAKAFKKEPWAQIYFAYSSKDFSIKTRDKYFRRGERLFKKKNDSKGLWFVHACYEEYYRRASRLNSKLKMNNEALANHHREIKLYHESIVGGNPLYDWFQASYLENYILPIKMKMRLVTDLYNFISDF